MFLLKFKWADQCSIMLFSERNKTMECVQNLTELKVLNMHTEKWQKLKPVWGTLIVHFQCRDHKQHVCTPYMGGLARTCMHFVSIPMQVCYILLHMLILLVVVFSDQYTLEVLNRDMGCKLAMAGNLHAWHLLCIFLWSNAWYTCP